MSEVHNLCMLYATAYNEQMMKRLESEKPEFFEEAGMTKREMIAHLTNNMCLSYTKMKSKVFRETVVQLKDKEHTTDEIRRLYNKGDRFHPYL